MNYTASGISALMAIGALAFSAYNFFSNQRGFSEVQRTQRLYERLYEFDRALIQYPDLQVQLDALGDTADPYFSIPLSAKDVKLKSFIYWHLNFFDEIMLTVRGDRRLEEVTEFHDWKDFILKKMRHPLFREVYEEDKKIFGDKLRRFLDDNWMDILAQPYVPGRF